VRPSLPIVGLQRLSLVDYPGKLCATAFTAGCNFRCPYCYNVDIVLNHNGMEKIPERELLNILYERKGFLDGLCIGGGEPTLHNGLLAFIYKVKSLGYLVKLDTNGSKPKRLKKLMEEKVIDYVAMDVKAPLKRYPEVVRFKVDVEAVEQSIRLLRRGSVDHEFRTTVVPGLLDGGDLEEIAQTLAGSKRYVIQQFEPGRTLRPEFSEVEPYSLTELKVFQDLVAPYFGECKLRF
jgi:pyruvate formate lyase activating enzyme